MTFLFENVNNNNKLFEFKFLVAIRIDIEMNPLVYPRLPVPVHVFNGGF